MANEKHEKHVLLSESRSDDDVISTQKSGVEQYEALHVSRLILNTEDSNKKKEDKFKPITKTPKGCCPATYADKIITGIYILCILTACAMIGMYFAIDESLEQFLSLLIVCVTTWLGVIIAIIAINKGLNIRDQADKLIEQNQKYFQQLMQLRQTRETILEDLKKTRNNARALTQEEKKLTQSVDKFGDLVGEFEKLKDSFGSSFKNIFNEMNESNSILQGIQDQNHRAKLYAEFFDASGDDEKDGLSMEEYEEFLDNIPPKYSDKFDDLGYDFDKMDLDHNGNISKYEFEKAVQKVIDA
eukprot:790854_1